MNRTHVLGAVLAIATLGVYAQVASHSFVEFDDPLYVTANSHVREGLSLEGVRWAFVSDASFLWQPVTWVSYLVDAEIWGVESAGPWLLSNVAIHIATSVLLLFTLVSLTGRLGPSAFVAAVFALHPLQVESVAWVSGRKEVLSGFFFVATLSCYGAYARRGGALRYAGVLLLATLGWSAKGSLVGLPFLLLLLDVWPLGRLGAAGAEGVDSAAEGSASGREREPPRARPHPRPSRILLEKLPLMAIALAVIAVQLDYSSTAANVWNTDPPLLQRVAGAGMAYVASLARFLWPTGLAIVYPTPVQMGLPSWPLWQPLAAIALLLGITGVAARVGRSALIGWLWFAGMLLPMSGLVPAGLRVMHDRYLYVPIIGLAIAIAFGACDPRRQRRIPDNILLTAAIVLLIVWLPMTWRQIRVWSDTPHLFEHALRVTERNAIVHYAKGIALARRNRVKPAIEQLETALAIHPGHADAHTALGQLLRAEEPSRALTHLRRAHELRPGWSLAMTNLAGALAEHAEVAEAISLSRSAVGAAPESADAHYGLGRSLALAGRSEEAIEAFRRALEIQPQHTWARAGLEKLER